MRGTHDARARWRDTLVANKPALIGFMTIVPVDRLTALRAVGVLDAFDVSLFMRCWTSDPDGWARLLDDVEKTQKELSR